MTSRKSRRCDAVVALVAAMVSPVQSAQATGVLWLPFSAAYEVYISCRWTCIRYDGSTYYHHATDYGRTGHDTEIHAAADGVVAWVHDGLNSGQLVQDYPYGNHVRIRHEDGSVTWYAHLLKGSVTVTEGASVRAGQLIGMSDNTGKSTGPHLHFEVRDPSGRRVNPYGDPSDYEHGCGPNALWATCPPTPAPGDSSQQDSDRDRFTAAQGDCDDANPYVYPMATERCNRRDDNCDGATDETWRSGLASDLGQPCAIHWESCGNRTTTGTWICAPDGQSTVCSAPTPTPVNEVCNGLDDDCNGLTDDVHREMLYDDTRNCGACGHICDGPSQCSNGRCYYSCWEGCVAYCMDTFCTDCAPCLDSTDYRWCVFRCNEVNFSSTIPLDICLCYIEHGCGDECPP